MSLDKAKIEEISVRQKTFDDLLDHYESKMQLSLSNTFKQRIHALWENKYFEKLSSVEQYRLMHKITIIFSALRTSSQMASTSPFTQMMGVFTEKKIETLLETSDEDLRYIFGSQGDVIMSLQKPGNGIPSIQLAKMNVDWLERNNIGYVPSFLKRKGLFSETLMQNWEGWSKDTGKQLHLPENAPELMLLQQEVRFWKEDMAQKK